MTITLPAPRAFRARTNGGGLMSFYGTTIAREVEKAEQDGRDADLAREWATAGEYGGLTDAECWDLFRRWCLPAGALAVDLIDVADLPGDRWFRNAWRRSPNGGPIWIDLERARPVQRWRIAGAVVEENARRTRSLTAPLAADFDALRQATETASSLEELRAIWPEMTQ